MTFDDLDFKNLFVAAESVKIAALAIEGLGKSQYAPAISALRGLSGQLYDDATLQAQREGRKARPLAEVQAALAKAAQKFVN